MNYFLLVIGMIVLFVVIFYSFISEDSNEDIDNLADEDEDEELEESKDEEKPVLKLVTDTPKSDENLEANETTEEISSENENTDDEQELDIFQEDSDSTEDETEDDKEEDVNETDSDDAASIEENKKSIFQNFLKKDEQPTKAAEITRIYPANKYNDSNIPVLEVGSEDDLRLRLELKQNIARPVSLEKSKCVAAVVQLRFPDDIIRYSDDFIDILSCAEKVFEKPFSFPFNTYHTTQLNRIWIFEPSEERDIIIESLIDAFELIVRFKKALDSNKLLRDNKVKIAMGLSMGEMTFINRGVNSEPSMVGKPVYLAETLADVVGDFGIYVDSIIRTSTIPIFDFKEWRPTVVRSNLPAIPLYELVGWNKPSEIASYVKNEDPAVRRAVAVAYRYFDLEDLHPLVELLRDKDRGVVNSAIYTISYIGNDKMNGALKVILPEAIEPDIKSKIIEAFGNAGNPSILPVVLASTKESNWKVRLAATKALYQLGGGKALQHLEPMLSDPDGIVRVVANSIFYKETNKPEYFAELIEGLHDASRRARATSIECLLAIDSEAALKEVTNVFPNQELDLQKHILTKMLNSKSKILYQCFLTMFKNSNEILRPYIIEAVRQAGIVS